MKYTANLNLKKPEATDVVDIQDLNANADIVDLEITKKATQSQDGRMSKEDKIKLDGVEEGSNKYIHPSTHSAGMIVQDSSHRFVTDTEKSKWNAKLDANVYTASDVLNKIKTVDGSGSSLDADTLDGKQLSTIESERVFRKKIPYPSGWSSYIRSVIVLHKIGTSDSPYSSPRAYCSGTFTFSRKAYSYKIQQHVLTGSGYVKGNNQGSILSQAARNHTSRLVEFDYNGIRYIGIDVYFTAAEVHDAIFNGEVGGRDIDEHALTWVKYYNEHDDIVYNAEIYDSIQDFVQHDSLEPTLKFQNQLVYHGGNSWTIVDKGSNANGEYIRFSDGTQICSRKVLHSYNTNLTQVWAFPATFTSITGIGYGQSNNMLEGTSSHATYWDNAHKTYVGTNEGSPSWITLTRETLFDARGYIYLTAIGKWK